MRPAPESFLVRTVTSPLFVVGIGLSLFIGLMIAVLQVYWWARTGQWHPLPLASLVELAGFEPATLFGGPGSGRLGKLVAQLIRLPLSATVAGLGAVGFAVLAVVATAVRRG